MGGLKRNPLSGLDRATAARALRFPPGRSSLTLGEAVAGRHKLIATCLSCWHEKKGIDPAELTAEWGSGTQIDDVAKRMRCQCGARQCVLGVRPAPPLQPH